MNIKKLFLILSLFSLFTMGATAQRDTLFTATKAELLYIIADPSSISVTVKKFNDTDQNYYYDSSRSESYVPDETNSSKFRNVKDITIVEIDSRQIEVNFTGATDIPNALSFEIPDPSNRVVKSFVGTNRNSFGLTLSESSKHRLDLISSGFGIGWVTPVNASPAFDTSMGRSLEFTWAMVLGARYYFGSNSIVAGLGLDWRNYSLKREFYYNKEEDGTISVRPFELGLDNRSSRLQTFSLQIPVFFHHYFGKKTRLSIYGGPILNFNTGAHITTKYKNGDKKETITTKGINQSPVTVDVMAGISWRGIGIYARYAPMRVLRSSTGLDFRSFSTGIILYI